MWSTPTWARWCGDHRSGEGTHVDVVRAVAVNDVDAAMHDALARQPLAHAGGVQGVDGGLLKDAGAYARAHVFGALPLDDHGIDARTVQ